MGTNIIGHIEPAIGEFPIVYRYIVDTDGIAFIKRVYHYSIYLPSGRKNYEEVLSYQIVYKKLNNVLLKHFETPLPPWGDIPYQKYFLFITYGISSLTSPTQQVSFFNGDEFIKINDWNIIEKLHKIIIQDN
jgi:hypothetical protein